MKTEELVSKINKGELDVRFAELYGEPFVSEQRKRYIDAINDFSELFGNDRDVRLDVYKRQAEKSLFRKSSVKLTDYRAAVFFRCLLYFIRNTVIEIIKVLSRLVIIRKGRYFHPDRI